MSVSIIIIAASALVLLRGPASLLLGINLIVTEKTSSMFTLAFSTKLQLDRDVTFFCLPLADLDECSDLVLLKSQTWLG